MTGKDGLYIDVYKVHAGERILQKTMNMSELSLGLVDALMIALQNVISPKEEEEEKRND